MALQFPTGRQGSYLALGILLALLTLAWLSLVAPLIDLFHKRADHLREVQSVAARMVERVSELPTLRQRVAVLARSGAKTTSLLSGASDAFAAADLQKRIQEITSTAGAAVSSVEGLQPQTVDAYRRIGLRVSFRASTPVLAAVLSAVERDNVAMIIDDLQIRGSPLPIASAPDVLDVAMSVYAFRAAGGGAS